ncbi:MAG: NTP transferase domain-containing protein [bacterium]|nr:NTP transferase domain-containing protein [bacterium]
MKVIPMIMAGGAGTRLWPLSRDNKPKQFHNLSGSGTLLGETITRLFPLKPEQCLVVTSKKYEDLSRKEIADAGIKGSVLSEPRPRNTAAAVLYAALYLEKLYDDSIMIVLPADHFIKQKDTFVSILEKAVKEAEEGKIVTIGVNPSYPETGYGYIKSVDGATGDVRDVDRFVEKPDIDRAKKYLESGNYYWNSGIFVWKTSLIMEYFNKLLPDHVKAFEKLSQSDAGKMESNDPETWAIIEDIFNTVESISIDYGILEHADNRVVIPGDFGWADLGSWKSIDDILPANSDNNRTPVDDKAIFVNSDNCSVFTEGMRVSVVGLSNIVVVEAGGEILVINKDSSQDVRKVVDIVKEKAGK